MILAGEFWVADVPFTDQDLIHYASREARRLCVT